MARTASERPKELLYVEKVNSSHVLRDCEVLRRLLQFLAEQALQHPNVSVKEQKIAEHLFGQPSDFDPRADSRVRVQIKRLREKLSKYYEESDAADEIVLQIPPGSYHLSFLYRNQDQDAVVSAVSAPADMHPLWAGRWGWIVAAGLAVLSIILLVRSVRSGAEPDPILKAFWRPFVVNAAAPLVIYGNSQYYDVAGTLREPGETLDGTPVNDSFTGVGEVIAAAELATLFHGFGSGLGFRRCLNVSWDEAKNSNLIFIGAFSTAIKALPKPEKFGMQTLIPHPAGEVRARIVNLQPGPGEPAYFSAGPSPCCRVTTQDHALITFSPALSPKRFTLLIAGATTLGTQEAVTFLCRPSSVHALVSRLPAPVGDRPRYFEAVIRVRISGGAPVHSEIAALHVRQDAK